MLQIQLWNHVFFHIIIYLINLYNKKIDIFKLKNIEEAVYCENDHEPTYGSDIYIAADLKNGSCNSG